VVDTRQRPVLYPSPLERSRGWWESLSPIRRRRLVLLGLAVSLLLLTPLLLLALADPLLRMAAASVDVEAEDTELAVLEQRSVVFAADGTELATLHDEFNRVVIPLEEVPDHVRNAVLAAEDRRFYEHDGYDLWAMIRAALANLRAGGVQQGASTITQQVAQQSFLTPEQTFARKLREVRYAIAIERELSKDEILQRYLNQVYFGSGTYGIAAASEEFFGVAPADLSVEQAAMLAAVIRAPSRLDPRTNPEPVRTRRDLVLAAMANLGHIPRTDAEAAIRQPVEVAPRQPRTVEEPYVVEAVRRELATLEVLGADAEERQQRVLSGGLQIHVTVQPALQQAAESAIAQALPANPGGRTAAIAAVDPRDGAVRALHGGLDFSETQFDLAAQGRRQPGSAFKPFVLVAALERGIPLDAVLEGDGPLEFEGIGPEPWQVANFGGSSFGTVTLTEATVRSINTAFAQVALAVGVEEIVDVAERLGIDVEAAFGDPSSRGPSIALGGLTNGVTPLEMASAYGALADQGRYGRPWLVQRIEGADGTVLFEREPERAEVIDPDVVAQAVEPLQQVVTSGTGTGASVARWEPLGKTGTTQNSADAWFVGAVPTLSTAVWVGHPEGQVPMQGMTGGSLPADLWRTFMTAALQGADPVRFTHDAASGTTPEPRTVTVPDLKGLRMAEALVAAGEAGLFALVEGDDLSATVMVQHPAAGSAAQVGDNVDIRASAPPPPEPAPTEPVPTEPVPTEPVPTEPVPTEPVPTEPAPGESPIPPTLPEPEPPPDTDPTPAPPDD
jgi:1A family penicillin-binding protein